jgi:hypothetical protein
LQPLPQAVREKRGFDDGTEWIMPLSKLNEQNQYIHTACLASLPVENLSITGFIQN